MAVLKHVFGTVKLVADSLAQAAALEGFAHARFLLVACSVAQALSEQQIGCQQFDYFAQGVVGQIVPEDFRVTNIETTRSDR